MQPTQTLSQSANDSAAYDTPAPQPFVHQPQAPWVPEEAKYSHQRYFSHGNENRPLKLAEYSCAAKLFRWATSDHVRLTLETHSEHSTTQTTLQLTAAELRELAARLLDAAHDLDTYPARVLMGGAA